MAKPQQPEIARSGRSAADPAAVKSELREPTKRGRTPREGTVPEDSAPGHHPEHEQDKPTGDAFVRKLHEHAGEVASREDDPDPTVAGEAFRSAAHAVRRLREAIPGD